jgi:SprT protein
MDSPHETSEQRRQTDLPRRIEHAAPTRVNHKCRASPTYSRTGIPQRDTATLPTIQTRAKPRKFQLESPRTDAEDSECVLVQKHRRNNNTTVPTSPLRYDRAIRAWAKRWHTPNLPSQVCVSFSPRLKRSLGRVNSRSGRITLHAGLSSAPRDMTLEVLCHEAAHIAAYLIHGPSAKPHGPEWRGLVQAAGYLPVTRLQCQLVPKPKPTGATSPRRIYRCPVCQATYSTKRRSSTLHCDSCLKDGVTSLLRPVARSHQTHA